MKKIIFFFAFLFGSVPTVFAQAVNSLTGQPARPGYANFHSNLGLQEIIEIGGKKSSGAIDSEPLLPVKATGLGERKGKEDQVVLPKSQTTEETGWFAKKDEPVSLPVRKSGRGDSSVLDISGSAGLRAYQTSNVLRVSSGEVESGVLETNVGAAVTRSSVELGEYVTMIPRLDLMMQWANYGEDTVNDLLDYRFSLVKGSLAFSMPKEWTLTPAIEYNLLNSQATGDRMFDAFAPSINLQKATIFDEKSILLYDLTLKFNKTDRVIRFSAPGVFADDGDNFQYSLNLTYIKLYGENNEWMLMPSMGVTRSGYSKNNNDGRNDYMVNLGLTGIYQWKPWLGFQAFANFTNMSTNSKGEAILGSSSNSKTFDIGAAITGNYQF